MGRSQSPSALSRRVGATMSLSSTFTLGRRRALARVYPQNHPPRTRLRPVRSARPPTPTSAAAPARLLHGRGRWRAARAPLWTDRPLEPMVWSGGGWARGYGCALMSLLRLAIVTLYL